MRSQHDIDGGSAPKVWSRASSRSSTSNKSGAEQPASAGEDGSETPAGQIQRASRIRRISVAGVKSMRRTAVALRGARPRRHGACSHTRVDPALFSLRELQSFTAELRLGDAEGRPGYERWVDAQWPPPWNEGFIGEGLMARLADGAMDATQPLELTARLTQHARAAGVHLLLEAFDADGSLICGAIAGSQPRRRTRASVRVVRDWRSAVRIELFTTESLDDEALLAPFVPTTGRPADSMPAICSSVCRHWLSQHSAKSRVDGHAELADAPAGGADGGARATEPPPNRHVLGSLEVPLSDVRIGTDLVLSTRAFFGAELPEQF